MRLHPLKFERAKRGWTQEQLSLETGISQNLISWWENNKCLPSIRSIEKLSKALHMDYEQTFFLFSPHTHRDQNE